MAYLNSHPFGLIFVSKSNLFTIDFLYPNITGTLVTSLYRKRFTKDSLLEATSYHLQHEVKNSPKSQFMRLRHICSSNDNFEMEVVNMENRFINRGYTKNYVKQAHFLATTALREDLLKSD